MLSYSVPFSAFSRSQIVKVLPPCLNLTQSHIISRLHPSDNLVTVTYCNMTTITHQFQWPSFGGQGDEKCPQAPSSWKFSKKLADQLLNTPYNITKPLCGWTSTHTRQRLDFFLVAPISLEKLRPPVLHDCNNLAFINTGNADSVSFGER